MTMGDRICVMKDGAIMQVAEPLTLYHHPANLFVAGFIGSPPMNLLQGSIRRHGGHLAFVEAGGGSAPLTFALDAVWSARAAQKIDQPVCLGIRPEHVSDRPGPDDAPPGAVVELKIEVAEPMGAETYLHCDTGAHPLIARVRPTARFEPGQRVRLAFDLAQAHLFDPVTGKVLR
jgi:multiple sugar transport system ATP-binding protein